MTAQHQLMDEVKSNHDPDHDTELLYLDFQKSTGHLSQDDRKQTAQTMAENLVRPLAKNVRLMHKLFRKRPPQQEEPTIAEHFAWALRSATGHLMDTLEEHTQQIANGLTDPNLGADHIAYHLDSAEFYGSAHPQCIACALEDAKRQVALPGRQSVHAHAIAEAIFHHIQQKVAKPAGDGENQQQPALQLKKAKENLVNSLIRDQQVFDHTIAALKVIEDVNQTLPD